jgi:hypothetical protein
LLVRDPKKLSDFPEAEKVMGDYRDVESLDRAFSGVSSAFSVSCYAKPGERAKLHRNAFQAARRGGFSSSSNPIPRVINVDKNRPTLCKATGTRLPGNQCSSVKTYIPVELIFSMEQAFGSRARPLPPNCSRRRLFN